MQFWGYFSATDQKLVESPLIYSAYISKNERVTLAHESKQALVIYPKARTTIYSIRTNIRAKLDQNGHALIKKDKNPAITKTNNRIPTWPKTSSKTKTLSNQSIIQCLSNQGKFSLKRYSLHKWVVTQSIHGMQFTIEKHTIQANYITELLTLQTPNSNILSRNTIQSKEIPEKKK